MSIILVAFASVKVAFYSVTLALFSRASGLIWTKYTLFPLLELFSPFLALKEGDDIGKEGSYDRFEFMLWDTAFCFRRRQYFIYLDKFLISLDRCHKATLLSLSVIPPS